MVDGVLKISVLFAVTVDEGFGIHGLFALRLQTVDGDKIAVGAFEHERRAEATNDRRIANNHGGVDGVRFEDDASFAEELVFWLREALVSDDLAVNLFGRVLIGLEERHFFGELGGKSGGGIILRGGGELADFR